MKTSFGGLDLLDNINQRGAARVIFHRRGQLIGTDGKPIPVKTFDISESGIGLMSPHPIATRQYCALSVLTLHTAFPELAVEGLVAYCMLSGTQGYRVGLQYTDVPPQIQSLIHIISARAL